MNKDSLGDRMKGYEYVSRNYLPRRIPVIIRIDGKAFHTFTKGFAKPFDHVLMSAMQDTMKYLCENIQGCVFGYTQSDEITLVLTDYATIKTDAWFGYNVQKMCSIAASMATVNFNQSFRVFSSIAYEGETNPSSELILRYQWHLAALTKGAMFDARAFSMPKDEVCNCLIWRQQDATRNSIQAVGQANFSHAELQNKSCNVIQEMLFSEKNINWNDFLPDEKRGTACFKRVETITGKDGNQYQRGKWIVDHDTPIFTQDRSYVERHLEVQDNA